MNIMCWIGFHDWRYHGDYITIVGLGKIVQLHICRRCKRVEVVFP
jgi:hypothetical protein